MSAPGLMLSFQYDTVLCEIGKPAETDTTVSVVARVCYSMSGELFIICLVNFCASDLSSGLILSQDTL